MQVEGLQSYLEFGFEDGRQQDRLFRNVPRNVAQGAHQLLDGGALRHEPRLEQVDDFKRHFERDLNPQRCHGKGKAWRLASAHTLKPSRKNMSQIRSTTSQGSV